MLRALTAAAAAIVIAAAGVALAAGDAEHPHDHPFSFDGPVGGYDMGAVQRGFQVYSQVCSTCHAMDHLAYRHLGEEGGPFAVYMVRDHETGEMAEHVGRPEHGGRFVDVTENRYVRSIAVGGDHLRHRSQQRPAGRPARPHFGSLPPPVPERDRRARRQWRRLSAGPLGDHLRAPRRRRLHLLRCSPATPAPARARSTKTRISLAIASPCRRRWRTARCPTPTARRPRSSNTPPT